MTVLNMSRIRSYLLAIFGTIFLFAWITHLIWFMKRLSLDQVHGSQEMFAGVAGFFPPLGIAHGILIWFGQ